MNTGLLKVAVMKKLREGASRYGELLSGSRLRKLRDEATKATGHSKTYANLAANSEKIDVYGTRALTAGGAIIAGKTAQALHNKLKSKNKNK